MSNWVTVDLQGGLGNQLFQIATAYNYSRKYWLELRLERPDVVSPNEATPRPSYWKNLFSWVNELKKSELENSEYTLFREKSRNYEEIPEMKGNVRLNGYFQSEKYFSEYFSDFLKNILCHVNIPKLNMTDNTKYIVIHVRRGDYVGHNFHTNLGWDYYIPAINKAILESKEKNVALLWFSDDTEWVEKNMPKYPCSNVIISSGTEIEQLMIMALVPCTYIIANSSYSWWGAYIGSHINKNAVVYAPKKWFNLDMKEYETWKDIYCENWVKILNI